MDLPSYKEEKVPRFGRNHILTALECWSFVCQREYSERLGVTNAVWNRAVLVHPFLLHLLQK